MKSLLSSLTFTSEQLIHTGTFTLVFIAAYLIVRWSLIGVERALTRKTIDLPFIDEQGVAAILEGVHTWVGFTAGLYVASHSIPLSDPATRLINNAIFILATITITALLGGGASKLVTALLSKAGGGDPTTAWFARLAVQFSIWAVASIVVLGSFGVDIRALVTGLGIGGVAVALAVQNILGDIFSSLSIVLDKPFLVGDFIVVGDFMGTVEKIGLKTTRVRSLSGEQLIFSNTELLKSNIRNYKRMSERRIEFRFGVRYGTSRDKLAALVESLRAYLKNGAGVRMDRVHFKGLSQSTLDLEIVYFYLTAEYNAYMDFQQQFNFHILAECERIGIEIAPPGQVIQISREMLKSEPAADKTALA